MKNVTYIIGGISSFINVIKNKLGVTSQVTLDNLYSITTQYKTDYEAYLNGQLSTCESFSNITTLKTAALYNQSLLTSVSLPKLTYFYDNTFPSNIQYLQLNEIKSLKQGALAYYRSLNTLILPKCTTLSTQCMLGCTMLSDFNFSNISQIPEAAFEFCENLTNLNLCNCTTVGKDAFYGCTNLTQVEANQCSYIGSYAFYATPLSIFKNHYSRIANLNHASAIPSFTNIYVLSSLVSQYKTAKNWSAHSNYIYALEE